MNIGDFFCGLLAGWSQVLVGQPLDFIKVRIQTSPSTSPTSTVHIAKDIYRTFGFKGFYRGSSSLLLGYSCTLGAEFFIYQWSKKELFKLVSSSDCEYDPAKLDLWKVGISGALAGWFTTFVNCPIEYAKIQRQMCSVAEGSFSLLLKEYFATGFKKIYRGFWVTALREVYGSFFYYLTYESIVRHYSGQNRDSTNSEVFLLAGATAGVCYHLLTYPIDTIKSNMQLGMSWKDSVSHSLHPSKMAGFKIALMWAILVNASSFWVYEHAQRGVNNMQIQNFSNIYSLH